MVVVDTPSLYLTTSAEGGLSQLEEEVRGCLSCCEEGNKVLVLVFQLGWFTQEDKRAVKDLESIFGEEVHNVLFTWKEDLESGDLKSMCRTQITKLLRTSLKGVCGRAESVLLITEKWAKPGKTRQQIFWKWLIS